MVLVLAGILSDLDLRLNPPDSEDSYRLIRLTLAYNGEDFHGWQSQPSGRGIQDSLEKALHTLLKSKIRVTASSRTDTGVHAEHQVVTFKTHEAVDFHRLVRGLNALLPRSVRARDAREVSHDFHPIRSAVAKVYRYRIWRTVGITPFVSPYVWHNTLKLNLEAMRTASKFALGQHDFTSFCAADSTTKTKIRTINDIRIVESGPLIELWFVGEGFLKQMVRILVGTLVAVGQGRLPTDSIEGILAAKDRRAAPGTAPAGGLCLVKVCYDASIDFDALLGETGKGYNLPLDGEWMGL